MHKKKGEKTQEKKNIYKHDYIFEIYYSAIQYAEYWNTS